MKHETLLVGEAEIELTDIEGTALGNDHDDVDVKLHPNHKALHRQADTVVGQVMGARVEETEQVVCPLEVDHASAVCRSVITSLLIQGFNQLIQG